MKKPIFNLRAFLILCAFVLACSTIRTQAQFPVGSYTNDFAVGANVAPFSGSGSVASWIYWYNQPGGNLPMTNTLEGGTSTGTGGLADPFAPEGAGALEVENPFAGLTGTNGSGTGQDVFFGTFGNGGGYDFSTEVSLDHFDTINFDIYVGPSQTGATNPANGTYGAIGVGIINSGYGFQQFGTVTIPGTASNEWVHLSVPIDHTQANEETVPGIAFDYSGYNNPADANGARYPSSNFYFWLGNLVMHYNGAPPPAPILSAKAPAPGLNVDDTSTGQYDRQEIQSDTTTGNSWVGHGSPVSYSFTITNWPATATGGIEAYLFLIGAPAQWPEPNYDEAADYNESNVLIFSVAGPATAPIASINYKVGEGGGNAMIYGNAPYTNAPGTGSTNFGSGALGGITSSTVLGTWTLTFNNDRNLTVTCPDGTTTNFTITEYDAQTFADAGGVGIMLGSQPNAPGDIYKSVVYSSFSTTGTADPTNDNFLADSTLNTNMWARLDTGNGYAYIVPTNTAVVVRWSVPDGGFSLEASSNLVSAPWFGVPVTPFGPDGTNRVALVTYGQLQDPNQTEFRLVQRVATQLQVLLPGQTNAPNTPSGYGGTIDPTQVYPGAIVNVTINAVDATYNIVSISDGVMLTSTDENDDYGNGNTAFLSSGSAVIQVEFPDSSPDTLTATDTTNPSLTAGTQTFTP